MPVYRAATRSRKPALRLPRRPPGRLSAASEEAYQAEVAAFCGKIIEIDSTLDFQVTARGYCYLLEQHGLAKGDFDKAQALITEFRKTGDLPLNICAVDETRSADGLEDDLDEDGVEAAAAWAVDYVNRAHRYYTPFSFWEDLDVYVEMAVEKIDLRSLFAPVCEPFRIPITNLKGWCDVNARAALMERFAYRETHGKRCVLLLCGDHDPGGLNISAAMRSNLADLSQAVGWSPDNLVIERFGLNRDFIDAQGLTWIDNLETSSGKRLDDPRHPDYNKPYVQNYIREHGVRKCEANALVTRPEAGRQLCRQAILRQVREDAIRQYEIKIGIERERLRREIEHLMEAGR